MLECSTRRLPAASTQGPGCRCQGPRSPWAESEVVRDCFAELPQSPLNTHVGMVFSMHAGWGLFVASIVGSALPWPGVELRLGEM
jgi:hypothetical protein